MKIKTIELLRSSQSWDGAALPDYPTDRPELIVKRMVFPVGAKTGWHHHTVINYGLVEQGALTIVCEDGSEHTFKQGEAIVEVIGTIHRGENRGDKPVILNMFYASAPELEITVQHPDFRLPVLRKTSREKAAAAEKDTPAMRVEKRLQKLVMALGKHVLTRKQIMANMGLKEKSRQSFIDNYYKPANERFLIEFAWPGTPNKPVQGYRLTPLGIDLLEELKKNQPAQNQPVENQNTPI